LQTNDRHSTGAKPWKRNGEHCKAAALSGQSRCAFHAQPGRAAELGRRGGERRTIFPLRDLKKFPPPRTAVDVLEVVAVTLTDVRTGDIDAKRANCISALAAVLFRVIETASLEARVTALETNQLRHGGKYGS
jgi:hypothetical protein